MIINLSYYNIADQKLRFWVGCKKPDASEERNTMATLNFNLESLEKRMNEGQTMNVSGLSLSIDLEIKEIPDLLKEVPAIVGSISAAGEKVECRNWAQLCDEKNHEAEKRREAEARLAAMEAKFENAEKRADRLREQLDKIKAE